MIYESRRYFPPRLDAGRRGDPTERRGMIGRHPSDEAAIEGRSHSATLATSNAGRWVLVATILGSSMVFIDSSVVNVVLPVLQADLHATSVELQWIVVGYTLFLSSLMLVGGSLGDHYGRRRMFLWGVVVFTVSSMACGLAPNPAVLIVARCVQGVGSALLTPGSLALIGATFAQKDRGKAIGTWSSVTAVMAALGPGVGGWLAEHWSWRWIFFINFPIAIGVLAAGMYGVPESKDSERVHHVDWLGAGACTAGLGGIVYGLTFSSAIWIAAGVIALLGFVVIEARSPAPVVPLRLFAVRTFSGVNALTLLLYGALAGALFFLPFEMIQIDGFSPTAAGFSFLPFVGLMFALSRASGTLASRIGARLQLAVGPLITGAGFVLLAFGAGRGDYWTAYFPAIVVIGVGMAAAVAPLTTTVMESVSADRMGTASGVNNAISRVAGMVAIAGMSVSMLRLFAPGLEHALQALDLPAATIARVLAGSTSLAATAAPPDASPAVRDMVHAAVVAAYLGAFRATMFVCALLAAAGSLVAALTIEKRAAA
jgi:EmrB/QacA subfamily drug resistance transporter